MAVKQTDLRFAICDLRFLLGLRYLFVFRRWWLVGLGFRREKNGGVVEYVVFDNEGHGFTKKVNEIRAYKAIADFLGKHLRSAS